MKKSAIRLVGLGLLSIALVGTSGKDPAACGPFLPVALFTFTKHPDLPLDRFARGQLGVLQPTYARSYLVVAYRQLRGLPVGDAEAKALVSLWHERLGIGTAAASPERSPRPTQVDPPSAWIAARREITGDTAYRYINVDRELPGATYEWYRNVQDDAFVTAVETLKARVVTFGKDSPIVREWIAAQDQVFAVGSAARDKKPSPLAPLAADAPALARADRAYQIASEHFYAGQFSQAREAFQAIARDEASPWHPLAPYLAARALLRSALIDQLDAAEVDRRLVQAIGEFTTIASSATSSDGLRQSSTGLREFAEYWRAVKKTESGTFDALNESGVALLESSLPGEAIGPALDRFTRLLDRRKPASPSASDAGDASVRAPLAAGDLIDWLDLVQSSDAANAKKAIARWREQKTLPWLVATLMNAPGDMSGIDDVLTAAAEVSTSSPAFATVAFHRARLLVEHRDLPAARTVLDRAIAQTVPAGNVPMSASNQLRTLRLRTARTQAEFLEDAAKPSVLTTAYDADQEIGESGNPMTGGPASEGNERPTGARLFDPDATRQINRLPLSELVFAAESTSLPATLRRDLAIAAWTRAVLLDEREQGVRIAPLLAQLAPSLAEEVSRYKAARTPEAARIEGTWTLLRFPGLSAYVQAGLGRNVPVGERDMFRNNWWCGEGQGPWFAPPATDSGNVAAAYLTAEARTSAATEDRRLAEMTPGTYLPRATVQWAKAQPSDPRLPEALHRAVMATRYGCTDPKTGAASREAFELLHARFPSSPWAEKTKYWYK